MASRPVGSVIWYLGRWPRRRRMPGFSLSQTSPSKSGFLALEDDLRVESGPMYWLWWGGELGCGRMASQMMARVGGLDRFLEFLRMEVRLEEGVKVLGG